MAANASQWDAKHREAAQKPPAPPAAILLEWLDRLPSGPALDLACGTGRHALVLASRGRPVTAVDWSRTALDILEWRARDAKIPVSWGTAPQLAAGFSGEPRGPGIHLIQADLEQTQLAESAFAVILCIQYLQRSLFPQISRALQPGGVLVFETFTKARHGAPEGPRNPAYLLDEKELRDAFPQLDRLLYREQGMATLVAQRRVK